MNFSNYRKYVVNNKFYEEILLDVTDWIEKVLLPKSVKCKDRFENINHPLVTSGEAYWVNNKTLCIGYKLKGNNEIFIPVFNRNKDVIKICNI